MTIDNDVLLDRIILLRRVFKEHEPIVFPYNVDVATFDENGKISPQCNRAEKNKRLERMVDTSKAVHRELMESYRVVCITDAMPDYVAYDLLLQRMYDAGGDKLWLEKIMALKAPSFSLRWLRKHVDACRKAKKDEIRLDEIVRVALMFEDLDRTRTLAKAA